MQGENLYKQITQAVDRLEKEWPESHQQVFFTPAFPLVPSDIWDDPRDEWWSSEKAQSFLNMILEALEDAPERMEARNMKSASKKISRVNTSDAQAMASYADDDEVMAAAEKAVGNWQKWRDFGWSGKPEEDAGNWTIVYTSNRDSTLLDQSNAKAIDAVMSTFPEEECVAESHSHWAVGHVDGYSIKVYDESGQPTQAFRAWVGLQKKIEEYPILDEDMYGEMEYEATVENIEFAGKRYLKEGVPEGWVYDVLHWFDENDPNELESRDDQGGYPSDEKMKEALDALGYLDEDDEYYEGSEDDEPPTEEELLSQQGVEREKSEFADPNQMKLQFDRSGRVRKAMQDESVKRIESAMQKVAQEGTHEGYKNYATWGVALIIANDRGRYEYWQEVAQEIQTAVGGEGSFGDETMRTDTIKYNLADRLKEEIEAEVEEASSGNEMISQLLQAGLSEVDWDEVAEDILSK